MFSTLKHQAYFSFDNAPLKPEYRINLDLSGQIVVICGIHREANIFVS